MAEQRSAIGLALVGKGPGDIRKLLLFGLVVRCRVAAEEAVELAVVQALDRRRAPDAAGVEANDVVCRPHCAGDDDVRRPGIGDSGPTGTAGIHHEGADPGGWALGGDLEHSELEGVALRV
jgi:hypothetical protein